MSQVSKTIQRAFVTASAAAVMAGAFSLPARATTVSEGVEQSRAIQAVQATGAQAYLRGFQAGFGGMQRFRTLANPPGQSPAGMLGGYFGSEEGTKLSAADLGTGVSGAAELEGFGVWGSVAYTDFEDDFVTTRMEGNSISGFAGIDHQFTSRLVGGVSVGRDDTVATTFFNSGDTHSKGLTLAPYVAYEFGPFMNLDSLSLDASVGMSQADVDTERRLVGGGVVRGDTDTSRKFGTINLTASKWFGFFNVSGTVGFLRSHDTTEAYRETTTVATGGAAVGGAFIPSSDSSLGQFRVGARASYYTQWVQPYVMATYEHDQTHPDARATIGDRGPNTLNRVRFPEPENDDDGVVVGGGVSLPFASWLSGSLEATTVEAREDFDSWTVSGNLRVAL